MSPGLPDFTNRAWARIGRSIGIDAMAGKKVYYVDDTAPGVVEDGLTPETAYLHPQTAIDAISAGDGLIILDGDYDCNGANEGLLVNKDNLFVLCSPYATFGNTKAGRTSVVYVTGHECKWKNGLITEGGIDGLVIVGDTTPGYNIFSDVRIYNCVNALVLDGATNPCTNNKFYDLYCYMNQVNLKMDGGVAAGGVDSNEFYNCKFVAGLNATDGIIDGDGTASSTGNLFLDCIIWYQPGSGVGINLTAGYTITLFFNCEIEPTLDIVDAGTGNVLKFKERKISADWTPITANWQTALSTLFTFDNHGHPYQIKSLLIDFQNMNAASTLTCHFEVYDGAAWIEVEPQQAFVIANIEDVVSIPLYYGNVGLSDQFRIRLQSDQAADNGQDINYAYMLQMW